MTITEFRFENTADEHAKNSLILVGTLQHETFGKVFCHMELETSSTNIVHFYKKEHLATLLRAIADNLIETE